MIIRHLWSKFLCKFEKLSYTSKKSSSFCTQIFIQARDCITNFPISYKEFVCKMQNVSQTFAKVKKQAFPLHRNICFQIQNVYHTFVKGKKPQKLLTNFIYIFLFLHKCHQIK